MNTIMPLERMAERLASDKSDSDLAFFNSLMYLGEMTTKLVVAGLVAAIASDKDRSRYTALHTLVRADGIGTWAQVLDAVLTGPASQHFLDGARETQRQLMEKCSSDKWQFECVAFLNECITTVEPGHEILHGRQDLRRWFREFAELRNKTKGHGAPSAAVISAICPRLESSINVLLSNLNLFQREWVFLHRNLSGKYRVTKLGESSSAFDSLKSSSTESLADGVYVDFGLIARVELAESDVEASDFFIANGAFDEKRFELLSYLTGDVMHLESGPYLEPIGPLPESETQGLSGLDAIGKCFTNLPPKPRDYVHRPVLEDDLHTILQDDRHPVVTLVGRGGIGKTSLALTVLHEFLAESKFELIVWFSSRDLDLLQEGPKLVQPKVLTTRDVANEYVRLVDPIDAADSGFNATNYLSTQLNRSSVGPTLFVFDNFETLWRPVELYKWLDTHVRLPNKILITTRHREFKGDYPIQVRGMAEPEAEQLIDSVAQKLGIKRLLTSKYRQELSEESDGHPYVIKILLGEVAKAQRLRTVERIVADSEELLVALFERTYAALSPGAQRVFLTLCNWRTTVPKLAIEAVLLRPTNERIAVDDCINELEQSSFIEISSSTADGQLFVHTPLVASLFGQRKLIASPFLSAVEADTELLQYFGAGQTTDLHRGVGPRIERLVRRLADKSGSQKAKLDEHGPMLEYIGRHYPPAWRLFASLYEETGTEDGLNQAKEWLRLYLETTVGRTDADSWKRLAGVCRETEDLTGELHALASMSDLPEGEFSDISSVANRFNNALSEEQGRAVDFEVKRVLASRIAVVMESRIGEGNATDRSRLAWLYLRTGNETKAIEHVQEGLNLDLSNVYCLGLAERLGLSH